MDRRLVLSLRVWWISSDSNLFSGICCSVHFIQGQDFPFQHISALTPTLSLIWLQNEAQLRTLKTKRETGHKTVFLLDTIGFKVTRRHWSGRKVGSQAAAAAEAPLPGFHPDVRKPTGRLRILRRQRVVVVVAGGGGSQHSKEHLWFILGRQNTKHQVLAKLSHSKQQCNINTLNDP